MTGVGGAWTASGRPREDHSVLRGVGLSVPPPPPAAPPACSAVCVVCAAGPSVRGPSPSGGDSGAQLQLSLGGGGSLRTGVRASVTNLVVSTARVPSSVGARSRCPSSHELMKTGDMVGTARHGWPRGPSGPQAATSPQSERTARWGADRHPPPWPPAALPLPSVLLTLFRVQV